MGCLSSCEVVRGLPDIQFVRLGCFVQCFRSAALAWLPAPIAQSGGDEETRTPDPLLAKEMLFQLSYVPLADRPFRR